MKIKLFIFSLISVLIFVQNSEASVSGPHIDNIEVNYQKPRSRPIVTERYKQKYGIKNNFSSDKTVADSDEKNENSTINNGDAPNEKQIFDNDGNSCQTNDKKMLFCVDNKGVPLSGKRILYNDDGKYSSVEYFRNGYLNGLCTYYDSKGERKESINYKMGIKDGPYKAYYSEHSVKVWANYKKGVLDGNLDIIATNGKLGGRMRYKKGILEKGYCITDGKKKVFDAEVIKSYPFNTINSCGVEL